MPMRVTPQPHDTAGSSYTIHSGISNESRAEDSGSGAESRARKRFQKSTSDGNVTAKRLDSSISSTKGIAEPRSNFTSRRRQSIRDQKAPLGPRPPDFSPSKRLPSDNPANSFSNSTLASTPNGTQESRSRQASINNSSRFSFGSIVPSANDDPENAAGPFDFLPSVNFDDFHTSITSNEPSLNEFPAPGRGGGFPAKKGIIQAEDTPGEANDKGQGRAVGAAASASRIGRSGSLLQRHNSVAKQRNQVSAGMEPMGPPSAPLPVRTRRQSEFPALSTNAVVGRPPRKSIGPGVIGADFVDRVTQRRRPSLTSRNTANNPNITDSSGSSFIRLSIDGNGDAANDKSSLLPTARNMKTKSLQPPSRQMQGHLCTPAMTPDHASSSSVNAARSPGRSAGRRTNTPSSAKRLSVMPVHATGLGARTISPTDARRLKRLSALQGAPPMPQTPPTPQPDPLSGFRSATQSPSLLPRKSVTPSSSRTTPEHNRKSYSSGLSISSNTSYNSLRTSSGSMQQSRFSQNISTSRLPTPKPRNDSNCAGGEEEVPPVPAIPKAYESPKAELDQPFFSVRKPSLPFDASSVTSTSTTGCVPRPGATLEAPIVDREARGRRGLTTGSGSDVEIRASAAPTMSKRKLQPLRLPPLNLLPLSTPTAAKIAALQEPSLDIEAGAITPPPKRGTAKTPSTPMTASKASFFSKSHQDEEAMPAAAHTRSSSSNHALRPETSSFRATSDSSSSGATATNSRAGRQAISPFISSSLPKASADFSYMRSKDSEVYNTINVPAETRSIRLTGPRAQTVSKVREEALTRPSSPTEGETPSLGTSIRRKLSVTRKKGITQPSQFPAEHDSRQPPQAPKHDAMPPPRLPASATWSGQLNLSPSPTTRPSLLQSKGKASSNGNINGHGRTRSDTWDSDRSPKKESVPFSELPDYSIQASPAKSSILSPMHRILSSKSPLNTMKARGLDTHLDRDDLSAEEEMKKLASKRKDFETAAREVDELRRRATPKERVSPTQALRMVNLNIFERGEIVDYKEIYFCGTQNAKKHVGDLNPQAVNFGYDDDRGDYNIVDGDHLAYRYEIVDILGKGSFGQVVRCVDHKTGGVVAVKIIRNKKRFHQQALVEVNILQKLREWDPQNRHSMVSFTQSFYFRGHLCISTELLGMNLYEFIKFNDFRGVSLKLIRRFTKQLLSSLLLLKGHKVIHCDLKPENILLAHPVHSEIKVIDFGSSCFENEKVYTYIQSRFYRSPEVILGMTYGMSIDMWSVGCILAELFTGYPIFPGENEQEQLACIMEVFGPPEKHLIEKSTRRKLFFDSLGKPRLTVSSKGRRRRPSSKSLQQALKCDDEAFLDFLTRCLRWDPDRRLQPDEAIHHEFVTGIKPFARTRTQTSNVNSSPIKRFSSVQTPVGTRPLPEPPATSFKNGAAVRNREVPSSSPNKPAPKRHSTVNGLQSGVGVKKTSNGAAISGSALPRAATRSASGKPDLAAAAAAASLRAR